MHDSPPTDGWLPREGVVQVDRPAVPGFEILEELGRGGMGVVYKARQFDPARLVALKMIRDGALAGPQQRARFRIEAEAAARVRHPNVVQIYEIAEHAGRPYFVMELVEGTRLDKLLAGDPQPATRAAGLLRTLALAVGHAHGQQIVHRDLKPANILFHGETPKITDFGLAKRLDTDSTGWTPEGAVVGTPNYMAPEQAAGRVSDVGPAADVYALGVILYEALVGRPPFQADSWTEAVRQVIHEEPAPPTRLKPDVPRDLETVCLKCLEKDPGRRYASAGELADDLGRFLDGKAVAAVPPAPVERLARLAGRDGYQILGEIGRGPRAVVYRARYGRLQQPLAVKVFTASSCPLEEWEARLRVDADRWATLTHPQVVPVQRAGWWDGAPYLVTEFVPQGSLAAKLTGRPWPVHEALALVEQVALILAYTHRQGVVHGNLKPANVLFAANEIPRLTDFCFTGGPFQEPRAGDEQPATGLGYLAPELARDPLADARPQTDVYGLGALLYELLTGRPLFAGADTREQVVSRTPPPLSDFNAAVTPQLQWVCMHCLEKNPWRRYARVYDVATRMRRFLNE